MIQTKNFMTALSGRNRDMAPKAMRSPSGKAKTSVRIKISQETRKPSHNAVNISKNILYPFQKLQNPLSEGANSLLCRKILFIQRIKETVFLILFDLSVKLFHKSSIRLARSDTVFFLFKPDVFV